MKCVNEKCEYSDKTFENGCKNLLLDDIQRCEDFMPDCCSNPDKPPVEATDSHDMDAVIDELAEIVLKDKIKNQRGSVLKKAIETINGDRQDSYGNPEDSFFLIAKYWSIYQGVKVTARNVAEMMTLFKIARMSVQKPEIDNYVDAAGYIGLAADMLEGK